MLSSHYVPPDPGKSRPSSFICHPTAGEVYQNKLLPGERRHDTLESAGVGVRVAVNDRFGASLEYAEPLNRAVASEGDRDGRVFFSLSAAF